MNFLRPLPPLAITIFLTACAATPRSAARPGVDFSKIRSVQIKAKDRISPLISRELLFAGLSPLSEETKKEEADAILKVAVTRESPEKRYVVQSSKKKLAQHTTASGSNTTSSTVQFEEDMGHDPVEISGGIQPYTQTILGTGGDSRIIASYAQATLSGELISPKTGEILWAASYSYEGIDLDTALEGAVRGLVRELPR